MLPLRSPDNASIWIEQHVSGDKCAPEGVFQEVHQSGSKGMAAVGGIAARNSCFVKNGRADGCFLCILPSVFCCDLRVALFVLRF